MAEVEGKLVKLIVEDEFQEDDTIIHSDLNPLLHLQSDVLIKFLNNHHQETDLKSSTKGEWKKTAITCLQSFVAINWFGVNDEAVPASVISILRVMFPDPRVTLELTDDNSYHDLKSIELLCLSNRILRQEESASIWKLRSLMVHAFLMTDPNPRLYLDVRRIQSSFQPFLTEETTTMSSRLLRVSVATEIAQSLLWFTDVGTSKPMMDNLREFSGLKVIFTGALGKRTRFQQNATPQLVVQLERDSLDIDPVEVNTLTPDDQPKNLALDDDTLLNTVSFNSSPELMQVKMYREEELFLLGLTHSMSRVASMDTDCLKEEVMTLLDLVIERTTVWTIRFQALYMRSKMEQKHNKRAQRAMVQLEHLVTCAPQWEPDVLVMNLKFFYATLMCPPWEVQRTLADTLQVIGCYKSALDIYSKLRSWEQMVTCFHRLDRKEKAEELVREQLAKQETPYLWCLLGDATLDITHYETAWTLSNQTYYRAPRSIGNYHFVHKRYEEAVPFFEESLRLNSMQMDSWQRLGFSALTTGNYTTAVKAYRRFVEFEPDVFEAWNNLSKAYIQLGKKTTAYSTLQEAIKCNYEEWKLWENYLIVAVDVGSFQEVVRCWHRLIDLKGKYGDDDIMDILVRAATSDPNIKDMNGNEAKKMIPSLLQLFARIGGTGYSTPALWLNHARLVQYDSNTPDKIVTACGKAVRAALTLNQWTSDQEKVMAVLSVLEEAANLMTSALSMRDKENEGSDASVTSIKLTIGSALRSVERACSSWDPERFDVRGILEKVGIIQALMQNL